MNTRLGMQISGEKILVVAIALVFSILNLLEVIVYKFKQPAHTIYIGISHWYQDYFFYLSQITQGADGEWLTHNAFTTERISPSFIWWYNILLGKITAIVHAYPWTVFNVSIFFLTFIYILFSYIVLSQIFPDSKISRFCALLIALTSTNLFTVSFAHGFHIQPITFFYAYTSAFNRLGGVSHLVAQNILSLLFIWLYARIISGTESVKKIILSSGSLSAVSVFLFIIGPVFIFTDLLVCLVAAAWYSFQLKNRLKIIHILLPLIVSGLILLPFVLLQQKAFTDPFYEYMRIWETAIPTISFSTFLSSSGIIVALVLFGIPFYLRRASLLKITGFVYAFLPVILYYSPIPHILRLPTFRFLQPPAYIFLAAIAVDGCQSIQLKIHHRLSKNHLLILITILFVVLQMPTLYAELRNKLNEYYLNSMLNYLDTDIFKGLRTLKNTSSTGNVLATNNIEFFVPVVSGRTVYSGHQTLTYNYAQKIANVYNFYSGKMTQADGMKFLLSNHIGYIVWNKQNGETNLNTYYPFLKLTYSNPALLIFSLQPK
jgi:hypothetical protein